jgi:hypothetical protein
MNINEDMHAIFVCDCFSPEHMVKVDLYVWPDADPDFCMSVTADLHLPWYRRILAAIKYIFGYPSLSWHDVLLKPADVVKLENIIACYKMQLAKAQKEI